MLTPNSAPLPVQQEVGMAPASRESAGAGRQQKGQGKEEPMAKNTGQGFRKGAVRQRSQFQTPAGVAKRGPDGRIMEIKTTGGDFKGVRHER